MTKNSNKAKKMEKNEITYNRMLIVFFSLFAVIFGITSSNQTAARADAMRNYIAPAIIIISLLAAVLSIVLYFVRKKKGINKDAVLSCSFICIFFLWLTSIFTLYFFASQMRLIVYAIVTAGVYFIYCFFPVEFFSFSAFTAIGAVMLSLANSTTRVIHYVIAAAVIIYSLCGVLVALLGKNKRISLGKLVLFDKKFKAYPFYIIAGMLIAGAVLSFFLANGLFYSLVVIFVVYMLFTVANTLKLM